MSRQAKAVRKKVGPQKMALSVSSGLLEGAFFPLSRKHNVIGRKVNANIPINDSKVSREHAAIDQNGRDYFISDLGSTNGTFINNERVDEPVKITIGDKIRIGSYTFRVEPVVKKETSKGGQKWGSETKVLFRNPDLENKNKVIESKSASKWQFLLPDSTKVAERPKGKFDHEKVKWALLAVSFLVIIVAMFTRVNSFS